MSTRRKAPEDIRADALARAVEKAEQGCAHCVEAYLKLAAEHGASGEEVDLARQRTRSALSASRSRWTRSSA